MSSTLICDFHSATVLEGVAWWKRLFDALRLCGFTFDNPAFLPDHKGIFHSWDSPNQPDPSITGMTYEDALLQLVKASGHIGVQFWSVADKGYPLEVTLQPVDQAGIIVSLCFPDSALPEPSSNASQPDHDLIAQRVRRWIEAIVHVYEICLPSTADIYWERWGFRYPIGNIGPKPAEGNETKQNVYDSIPMVGAARTEHEKLMSLHMSDGTFMYVVDPMPIPWRGSWILVGLSNGTMS